MKIVIKNISNGGIETLIYRYAKELLKEGRECELYCRNISAQMEKKYIEIGLSINKIELWDAKILAEKINDSKALVFLLPEFIAISAVLEKKHLQNNIFMYVVHPSFTCFYSRKLFFLNGLFKKKIKDYLCGMDLSGHLFFMDEQCIEDCEAFYGISLSSARRNILRLPFDALDLPAAVAERMSDNSNSKLIHILSVFRADFPFKGYVKGLIEILQNRGEKIFLQLISSGDGIPELQKWIASVNNSDHLMIDLQIDVPYEKLYSYYDECDLYIGMGSTIIEAASRGKICIAVKAYTYQFVANCFFHEKPNWIVVRDNEVAEGALLLDRFFKMSEEERAAAAEKNREAFQAIYSMKCFVHFIDQVQMKENVFALPKLIVMIADKRMRR